jgi:hypothetical protein
VIQDRESTPDRNNLDADDSFVTLVRMFVRWQKRQNGRGRLKPDARWDAFLVETIRINGKPRAQYISCIASIKQSQIDADIAHQRCWFWDGVLDRLHQPSAQISERSRARVIASIAKKVPMPTRAEYEFCHRSVRGKFGVTSPLPAHPLYELPANFLDELPLRCESSESAPPAAGKPRSEPALAGRRPLTLV